MKKGASFFDVGGQSFTHDGDREVDVLLSDAHGWLDAENLQMLTG